MKVLMYIVYTSQCKSLKFGFTVYIQDEQKEKSLTCLDIHVYSVLSSPLIWSSMEVQPKFFTNEYVFTRCSWNVHSFSSVYVIVYAFKILMSNVSLVGTISIKGRFTNKCPGIRLHNPAAVRMSLPEILDKSSSLAS